jgi:hypothetical protein
LIARAQQEGNALSSEQLPEMPGVDAANLYRQESYTDLQVGSIQCLFPVKDDGSKDESRKARFIGSTSLMTPQGALPVQADIEAETLAEAAAKFPEAVKASVERMIEEAREMERQARSNIVVPKGGNVGGAAGGLHIP